MVAGDKVCYRGDEVTIEWIGKSVATVIDSDERPLTVPITRLKEIKMSRTISTERKEFMLSLLRSAPNKTVLNTDFIVAGEDRFGKPWHRFSCTVQDLRKAGYVIEDTISETHAPIHQTRLVSEPTEVSNV